MGISRRITLLETQKSKVFATVSQEGEHPEFTRAGVVLFPESLPRFHQALPEDGAYVVWIRKEYLDPWRKYNAIR